MIDISQDGPLTVLTFSNGEVNLWDKAFGDEWRAAIERLVAEPPRGLLIRAEGRIVTGGVDVHEFEGLNRETGGSLWSELIAFVQSVEDLPCPTVFAAHALCLTWGFEIAMACDLLVASEKAKFGLVEKVVGITPAMGGTQRLALRAGPARAKEFVMTGELYDAPTLHGWGAVNKVWPAASFEDEARAFARSLADGPTQAHAVTKKLVDVSVADGARAADALVPELCGGLFDTEDAQNAIASFLRDGPGKATYVGR
ncbi:enoyl-CoA hydratase/isomerase family protein [Conexibacter sp. SYSU D00693]|uniref:enoyl-CoA hydratase/isomerase family protein n=1 Tax=Conexibacter sp. SYSU D00693 TaxID=2812560 RepID=UPI001F11C00F|nr:enoyl-CoA hydratase/isomerase family protein [Conexibacter sp. SYSU D00693]